MVPKQSLMQNSVVTVCNETVNGGQIKGEIRSFGFCQIFTTRQWLKGMQMALMKYIYQPNDVCYHFTGILPVAYHLYFY